MLKHFLGRIAILGSLLFLAACNLNNQAEITPEATADIPTVQILAPSNNRQVIIGTEFDFDILGQDSNAGVARLALYIDGELIGEASPIEAESVPIFRATINWLAPELGRFAVEAIAYRADGTRSDAAIISIEVIPRE